MLKRGTRKTMKVNNTPSFGMAVQIQPGIKQVSKAYQNAIKSVLDNPDYADFFEKNDFIVNCTEKYINSTGEKQRGVAYVLAPKGSAKSLFKFLKNLATDKIVLGKEGRNEATCFSDLPEMMKKFNSKQNYPTAKVGEQYSDLVEKAKKFN